MCFYSALSASGATRIKNEWDVVGEPISGNFNGFEHPITSVLTASNPNQILSMEWGLLPHWAQDRSFQKSTLNAKGETCESKPSFKEAQRCLVLADSFFEWRWLDVKGKQKQKFELTLSNQNPFAFAGLYDEWWDPHAQQSVFSYAIVTTEAQGIMREIHNSKLRMPLIVDPADHKAWLHGEWINPVLDIHATPNEASGQLSFWTS
ncbi:MAG: SOS response-associated peptidase [Flavobacteriaceae bacterium]